MIKLIRDSISLLANKPHQHHQDHQDRQDQKRSRSTSSPQQGGRDVLKILNKKHVFPLFFSFFDSSLSEGRGRAEVLNVVRKLVEVKERAWGVVKGQFGVLSFLLCCVGRGGAGRGGEREAVCAILLRLHEILCEDVFSSSSWDVSHFENRVKVLQGFQDQLVRVIDQHIREGYDSNTDKINNDENSTMEVVVYELLLSVMKWSRHAPPSLSSSPSPTICPSLLSLSPSLAPSLSPSLSPSPPPALSTTFFNAPVYVQLWAKASYLLRCLSASFLLPSSSSSPSFRVVVEEIYKLVHQEKKLI